MFRLTQMFARIRNRCSQRGFTLMETVIALGVASISVIGAYSLALVIEKHYRSSSAVSDVYRQSRIAMERMFRDISETSNETITITYDPYDAISFASARDENGDFQSETYGALNFSRPVWQKAIVYYTLPDNDGDKDLYRKEIPKTDWSTNYDPVEAMDTDGEVIAGNLTYMYFDYYPADALAQAHVLSVSLGFLITRDEVKVGPVPGEDQGIINLSTRVPIMNREK